MTTIARRIVSGQKSRFKDPTLDVDLDLTYVTDHLIIMGFPAAGIQSWYRNKRSQVKTFLDRRHDDLYRVYNLCPVTENSYGPDEFHGRISRFPFPDHHVPPLSLIPLFVADITDWLESDPDAVAVIHCKAGKGRSGTMTCCYLVSLPYLPTAPNSIRNYSGMKRPDANMESPPPVLPAPDTTTSQRSDSTTMSPSSSGTLRRKPSLAPHQSIICNSDHDPELEIQQISQRLQTIFDLHTQRRLKPQKVSKRQGKRNITGLQPSACSTGGMPSAAASSLSLHTLGARPAGRSCDALQTTNLDNSLSFTDADTSVDTDMDENQSMRSIALNQNTEDHSEGSRPRMGVSIPSQQRWVGYWTRILSGRDPRLSMTSPLRQPRRQVRITRITLDRQSPGSSSKASHNLFERLVPQSDAFSVQLVRYEDSLVDRLEHWERHARRRARAFGAHNPSAPAHDLDAEEQAQKQHLKTLRRKASDLKCWDGEKFGEQHEKKIGDWGVHTKAEAERARAFDWKDDQPQLEYFSLIPETGPRQSVDKQGNLIDSSDSSHNDAALLRYTFVPEGQDSKGRNASNSSAEGGIDSGYHSNNTASTTRESSREPSSSSGTSGYFPSESAAMPGAVDNSIDVITPPSAVSYESPVSTDLRVGQIIDADREICVKVLVGRTGKKHAKMPDITSAGWCWFIPSFEDPITGNHHAQSLAKGAKTQIRFESHEIDFRKQPLGLVALQVEWEWVHVGIDDEAQHL